MTIVTPSFNQGQFLEETIRSVLLQGYPNLEYMVIDGGSTDDSASVIGRYAPWIDYWVSEKDRGQSHAINKGWARARGDVLNWLNSDDLFLPGTLRAVAEAFTANVRAAYLVGTCVLTDAELVVRERKPACVLSARDLLLGGFVPGQPSVFFRREVVENVGGMNENLHYVLDWDYWIRIGIRFPEDRAILLDRDLTMARCWAGAKTAAGVGSVRDTSAETNGNERRVALEALFGDKTLPAWVHDIRSQAFGNTFWYQARHALRAGKVRLAVESIRKARRAAPGFVTMRSLRKLVCQAYRLDRRSRTAGKRVRRILLAWRRLFGRDEH